MFGTFEEYMRKIDRALLKKTGAFDSGDLIDWHYRDAFEDEVPVAEVVESVLIENGYPDELL